MKFPRRAGVLLHPTSLEGRFGIGDLGDAAFTFVDFLVSAKQTYWQVLPLSPTGYGDSPYQGLSAFAGNPMLINLERLVQDGHLAAADVENTRPFPSAAVNFGAVIPLKTQLLDRAFENFSAHARAEQHNSFLQFCRDQSLWLDDFALYMALKETHNLKPWNEWEPDLASREPQALARAQTRLAHAIENQKFRQWLFFTQWLAVKKYANERDVRIIGDLPIYVAMDSADVWSSPRVFLLDSDLAPIAVAGVPPDYFSETGQLWGNPLYRWDVMKEKGYTWWIERFRNAFILADVVRIDHFRGFHNYWAVPAGEETAVKGEWLRGPGADLFHAVTAALGDVAIIAEDLGDFDSASRAGVDALQAEFGFPGMKVVQFAFSTDATDPFLPHNFTRSWVAYTGTHDNDTAVGWYQVSSTEKERDYARRYMARDGSDISWDLIRLAWSSVATTAMTTAQDLLSLGHDARMNTPSTTGAPNWCWRLPPGALSNGLAARLREQTEIYGRIPERENTPAPL